MQLRTFVCDRCRHEVRKAGEPEGWVSIEANRDLLPGIDEIDLCGACFDGLRAWLEMLGAGR